MERMGKVKLGHKAAKGYSTLIFIAALILVSVAVEQTSGKTRNIRNPFSFPPGVHLSTKGHGAEPKEKGSRPDLPALDLPPPFKVRAILISSHIRLASIGSHIVTIGDSIFDEKVLEITRDKVVLGKGNNKRTLLLEQSPIRFIVEEK